MNEPLFSYAELVILALAIPLSPIVAWILCDTFDALLRWFGDARDCLEECDR